MLCHTGFNYLFRAAAPRDYHRHSHWIRRTRLILLPHGPHAIVGDLVDGGGHWHARGQRLITWLVAIGHVAAVLALELVSAQALRLFG